MSATDTPDLPYPSLYAEVLGARMHYMTQGAGDTVLALISGGASSLLVQPAGEMTRSISSAMACRTSPISTTGSRTTSAISTPSSTRWGQTRSRW